MPKGRKVNGLIHQLDPDQGAPFWQDKVIHRVPFIKGSMIGRSGGVGLCPPKRIVRVYSKDKARIKGMRGAKDISDIHRL